MTNSSIARWVKAGRLHPLHRGVYLLGHPVPPPLAAEQAALLAAGDDSVLSHWTAALHQGFVDQYDGPIHVTTSRHRGRPRGVYVHTSRRLEPRDTTYRHGLPITTPARTLLDFAEVARDAGELERAVETAFAKRRVTERQLRAVVQRNPGRRGGRRLTALLDYRGDTGFTRSWAEDRLRRLLRPTHLPQPKSNDRVAGYEVDFHFVEVGVIVEVDSWAHHSGHAAFGRDRRKWADLQAKGYTVVPVTAYELEHEPEAVIARIAAAVALASQR